MNIVKKLLNMKENIKDTELKKAQIEGRLAQLMKDLKKMGHDNVTQAGRKLKSIRRKIESLDKEINKGVERLQRNYDWEG